MKALKQTPLKKGAVMTIADLITSAGASITLLRTAIAARDESKIEAALSDLQTKYGDLGGMVIGLVEKSMSLQDALVMANHKNAELKLELAEQIKYKLKEVAPGKFAYFCEASNETGEPAHYLCQPCKDAGIKSVLHIFNANQYFPAHYECHIDKKSHSFYV